MVCADGKMPHSRSRTLSKLEFGLILQCSLFSLLGSLGKRTKFQEKELPQMVLDVQLSRGAEGYLFTTFMKYNSLIYLIFLYWKV